MSCSLKLQQVSQVAGRKLAPPTWGKGQEQKTHRQEKQTKETESGQKQKFI